MSYVGRFAPSPTGPLHLGSLVAAVASFLHARQAGGEWLVRIEDVDPPREVAGAASSILRTLESFDLTWDRSVLYQSSRLSAYHEAAQRLLAAGLAFRCRCSRSEIRATGEGIPGRYPGTCRDAALAAHDTAVRVRVASQVGVFTDGLQGESHTDLSSMTGDYVIVRRDGLPAYHLAVVVDDAAQGITTIVRGIDLLESTPAHLHLQHALSLPTPHYYHVPVIVNELGQKLSKQTGATPVAPTEGVAATVLRLLGLHVPSALEREPAALLWQWAQERWSIDMLRGHAEIAPPR